MSDNVYPYRADQELPSLTVDWADRDDQPIDFSTGWTFTVKLAPASEPTAVKHTKTSGITGAATFPNVQIDWSTSDWSQYIAATSALPVEGRQLVVYLYARRTADGKDRVFSPGDEPRVLLLPAPV